MVLHYIQSRAKPLKSATIGYTDQAIKDSASHQKHIEKAYNDAIKQPAPVTVDIKKPST